MSLCERYFRRGDRPPARSAANCTVGLPDRIRVFHCRPSLILLTNSGGYHGPACQVIRFSWPDISSEKPLCARSDETGLVAVLSRQKPTHRAIGAGIVIVVERPETNPCFWERGLPMCTSSMGRHICSTCRPKNRELAQECSCAPLSPLKEST